MARENAALYALNRGEVSKDALARIDVEKLKLAAASQVNWLPTVLGPMMLRPGLGYIGGTLSDAVTRNIRFFFATNDTALLELTPSNMRIRINDALVVRAAVSTAVTSGDFSAATGWDLASGTTSGASCSISPGELIMSCLPLGGLAQARQGLGVALGDRGVEHGIRIVISRGPVVVRIGSTEGESDYLATTTLDTGTHSLAFTPTGATAHLQIETGRATQAIVTSVQIDSAGALTLPTPWGSAQIPNIRYDQSGDIIYVGCHGLQQRKIERRSATSWSVAIYESNNGPFQTATTGTGITLAPSAYYGFGTLTASRPFFNINKHFGCLFRFFSKGQILRTSLGGDGQFGPACRVAGIGSLRNIKWTRSGTWVGTLTLQISFDGPNSGFVDVASSGANGTSDAYLAGTTTPSLDNQIVWYRIGFKPGSYSSGSASVEFDYTGGGKYAIVRVVGVQSELIADINILEQFSSTDGTTNWTQSDWSDDEGWPDSVQLHEGRLWWFGRDRHWGSQSNNFTGFAEIDATGVSLGDAATINEAVGYGPVDKTSWGLGLTRLLVGRDGSVASIRASSFDEVVTPTNISIKDCTTQGAAPIAAVKIGTRGIYINRANRRVYELAFNPQAYDYQTRDLTRLNLDIGVPGFSVLDIALQPDGMIYLPRTDGQCAAMLYDVDDAIEAWWRIQTLGVIEDVCVLPSVTLEDNVYFVVKRVINGSTKRFVEKLALRSQCVGGTLNRQMDAFLVQTGPTGTVHVPHLPNTLISVWADGAFIGTGTTDGSGNLTMPDGNTHTNIVAGITGSIQTYSGAAASTMTGLSAFEGQPCEVFADQQPSGRMIHVGPLTVTGGTITLPNGTTSSQIVAMFGYVAPFMSAKLAYAAQAGSPLTQKKKIDHVGLVMFDTHPNGLQMGQRFDHLDPLPLLEDDATIASTAIWNEYDEPAVEVPGEWSTDARLCLLGQAPYPVKVGAAVIAITTNEKV